MRRSPAWARPRARSVLRSWLSQDERSPEPIPSWVGIEPMAESDRVRTKPSGIRAPSLEPRPRLASSGAPGLEESLRVKPNWAQSRTPSRSPSRDADPSFEQSWSGYRASSLVRAEPILELRRAKLPAKTSSASSRGAEPDPKNRINRAELSLELSRAEFRATLGRVPSQNDLG